MKVRFWCDSGANIHSRSEDILDLEEDLGITPEEWADMPEHDKFKVAEQWAYDNGLEIGWQEVDQDK